jgi:hypothetical protein
MTEPTPDVLFALPLSEYEELLAHGDEGGRFIVLMRLIGNARTAAVGPFDDLVTAMVEAAHAVQVGNEEILDRPDGEGLGCLVEIVPLLEDKEDQ